MNFLKYEKIDDMVNMIYLNEVFVLYNLRFCYKFMLIYVSIIVKLGNKEYVYIEFIFIIEVSFFYFKILFFLDIMN